jgi:hypothetical protein
MQLELVAVIYLLIRMRRSEVVCIVEHDPIECKLRFPDARWSHQRQFNRIIDQLLMPCGGQQ